MLWKGTELQLQMPRCTTVTSYLLKVYLMMRGSARLPPVSAETAHAAYAVGSSLWYSDF